MSASVLDVYTTPSRPCVPQQQVLAQAVGLELAWASCRRSTRYASQSRTHLLTQRWCASKDQVALMCEIKECKE